jgi:LuxR family maltose regulon positive regulatory protein
LVRTSPAAACVIFSVQIRKQHTQTWTKTTNIPSAHAHTAASPKLQRPWLPALLERKRLLEQLNALSDRPCGWVSGPAGAGKTALMASYLERLPAKAGWYRIDEDDANPAEFFFWLATAVRPFLRPNSWLPEWRPEYVSSPRRFARHFVDALLENLGDPLLLVLDDYHRVSETAAMHALLREMLERLTGRLRIWIVSRNPPPAPFARLSSHGIMGLLTESALAFSRDEALALAVSRFPKVQPGDVDDILARTRGWVVATTLMLSRIDSGSETAGSEADLFDLLQTEVLGLVGQDALEPLCITALLPYITGNLLQRLTGSTKSLQMIEELARRGHFVAASHGASPSYELHALFRDFLLSRGEQLFRPRHLKALRARAARALESEDWEASLDAWLAMKHWKRIGRLLSKHGASLLLQGRHSTLAAWLESVPPHAMTQHPALAYWHGESLMAGNAMGARTAFDLAFETYRTQGALAPALAAWSGGALANYMARESYRDAPERLASLESLTAGGPLPEDPQLMARLAPAVYALMITALPGHPDLEQWEKQLLSLIRRPVPLDLRLLAGTMLLHRNIWFVGDYGKASLVLDVLAPLFSSPDQAIAPLQRCMWLTMLCGYHYCFGRDTWQAIEILEQVDALAQHHGLRMWDYPRRLMACYLHLSEGSAEDAQTAISTLAEALNPAWTLEQSHFHVLCAWRALLQQDVARVRQHLNAADELDDLSGFPHNRAWIGILRARAAWLSGDHQGALRTAAATRRLTRTIGSRNMLTACLFNTADIALSRGHEVRASALLRNTLARCRSQHYRRLPTLLPDSITRLMGFALEHDIEPGTASRLVHAYGLRPGRDARWSDRWPWVLRIYTLGRFEIVLHGAPLRFGRKIPANPLRLLKALIASGNRQTGAEQLADALWPDLEGDSALANLNTTLYRLRRLLGDPDPVHLHSGYLSLDRDLCWVDAWALLEIETSDPVRTANRALRLYTGSFLPMEDEAPWSRPMRRRLRRHFCHLGAMALRSLEAAGQWEAAERIYRRILAAEPESESVHQCLAPHFSQYLSDL